MTVIVPNKGAIVNTVIYYFVHLWVTTAGRSTFLLVCIQVYFLNIENWICRCRSGCYYFCILQMQIIIFIICNKAELVTPGPETFFVVICFQFVYKIFRFVYIFCRYPPDPNIKKISNSPGIDILIVIQETKKIIAGVSVQWFK